MSLKQFLAERWLLIGHRGSGKTQLLHALAGRFEIAFDLDSEIVKRGGKTGYRQIEEEVFRQLLNEIGDAKSCAIALSANYAGTLWPRDFKTLWIRRETDVKNDSFADYLNQETRYQKWADVAWTLPEGEGVVSPLTPEWPMERVRNLDVALTLKPQLHRNPEEAMQLRKSWGCTFEIRTDLWPPDRIKKMLQANSSPKLLSVRTPEFSLDDIPDGAAQDYDWELSLGEPKSKKITILSLHDFSGGLGLGLSQLAHYKSYHLKASPIIERWEDLELLWRWWKEDPANRSILPRAKLIEESPRWQWFRLYMKGKQKLNFLREGGEGLRDQPTICQWVETLASASFGAVIGEPVEHSFSPVFHRKFFAERSENFFAIPILPKQLTKFTMQFLETLGASAFAVTSPHKESAELHAFAGVKSAQPINTLSKNSSGWISASTDSVAMRNILSKATAWNIFGSGSMGRMAFEMAQNAALYSGREQKKLKEKGTVSANAALVWTAGDEVEFPQNFHPPEIFDLSYTDRSKARSFAFEKKIPYSNGLDFFKQQALEQQKLWSQK